MKPHEAKTYGDLLEILYDMDREQLNCDIAIELELSNEVYSSVSGDVRFDVADIDNDMLDENHPVFILKY